MTIRVEEGDCLAVAEDLEILAADYPGAPS